MKQKFYKTEFSEYDENGQIVEKYLFAKMDERTATFYDEAGNEIFNAPVMTPHKSRLYVMRELSEGFFRADGQGITECTEEEKAMLLNSDEDEVPEWFMKAVKPRVDAYGIPILLVGLGTVAYGIGKLACLIYELAMQALLQ